MVSSGRSTTYPWETTAPSWVTVRFMTQAVLVRRVRVVATGSRRRGQGIGIMGQTLGGGGRWSTGEVGMGGATGKMLEVNPGMLPILSTPALRVPISWPKNL